MTHAEMRYRYTLRRRRLVGLGLLLVFITAGFAVDAWRLNPLWALLDNDEGTFTAGDPSGEWIYAACDGERQQIAVLRDGRLEGVAALASLRTIRFPNWCDLPTVDHPDLQEWQSQLSRLRSLSASPDSVADEIMAVARTMSVPALYVEPMSAWFRADAANAATFLDAVAADSMFPEPSYKMFRARWSDSSRLVSSALDSVAASAVVAPERLTAWLADPRIARSERALQKLAAIEGLDDGARAALLERLDTVSAPERAELYGALASHLVSYPEYSALLARQLRLVMPAARVSAARQLLAQPGSSVQFAYALLSTFDDLFHQPDVQLDMFIASANVLADEPDAPLLLTRHLRDISGIQRRMAATHLLTLDGSGETDFALAVLRSFSDFHPLSRPKVIQTVMHSEQFAERRVQEACLLAIRLELNGPEKNALLSEMLRHHALDDGLHSRIRAELG